MSEEPIVEPDAESGTAVTQRITPPGSPAAVPPPPGPAVAVASPPRSNAIAPWWHYAAVGVIGMILGALVWTGVLATIDRGQHARFGGPGQFQRFDRGPGFGPRGYGPRPLRPRPFANGSGAPLGPRQPLRPAPLAPSPTA